MCEEIVKIVLEERRDDYMAFIEGHREIWGHGKNFDEAIGDLVRSHQNKFCINIKK